MFPMLKKGLRFRFLICQSKILYYNIKKTLNSLLIQYIIINLQS